MHTRVANLTRIIETLQTMQSYDKEKVADVGRGVRFILFALITNELEALRYCDPSTRCTLPA